MKNPLNSFLGKLREKRKETQKEKAKPPLEKIKSGIKKNQQKSQHRLERKRRVKEYFEKAGLLIDPADLSRKLFRLSVGIIFFISCYLIYSLSTSFGITWSKVALWIGTLWIFGFLGTLFAIWILLYIIIDVRIFKRRLEIEDILPDFLQLASGNIKAGMTIDRALWYAVRPNFGVLAKEIEIVAKETMSGEDLKDALRKFSSKYDSMLLQRSVSLIIEGIESGGEIGDLLIKVASNIEDQKIMKKEMSANVTTYVIFITFASIIAAPFLFALSGALIEVLHTIASSLQTSGLSDATTGSGVSFSESGIEGADFTIFSIISLTITAVFSAMIISMIKKGNVKEGAKNIPVFVLISLTLYLFARIISDKMLGVFF